MRSIVAKDQHYSLRIAAQLKTRTQFPERGRKPNLASTSVVEAYVLFVRRPADFLRTFCRFFGSERARKRAFGPHLASEDPRVPPR